MVAPAWRSRIHVDPVVHHGQPVISSTRVAVSVIVGSVAEGEPTDQILQNYPQLTRDDIHAALHYAAEAVNHVDFVPLGGP